MLQSVDDAQLNIQRTRGSHAKYLRSPMSSSRTSSAMRSHHNNGHNAHSPRRCTPRKIRGVASTPMSRSSAAKRVRARASRLDSSDRSNITSFPSPNEKDVVTTQEPIETSPVRSERRNQTLASPFHVPLHSQSQTLPRRSLALPTSTPTPAPVHVRLDEAVVHDHIIDSPLGIIEDYIPRPLRRDSEMYDWPEEPEEPSSETWKEYLWKKSRWRWRVQGLSHS